jgi:hypothetical protein
VRFAFIVGLSFLFAFSCVACSAETGSRPQAATTSVSPSPSPDPPPQPPNAASSLADDFSDSSTGWDSTGAAKYRDGKLVVGDDTPSAMLVPSPLTFNGPRTLTATASIRGSGHSVIGLFCRGSIDLSSAYVAFVDPLMARATIGRLSPTGGAEVMGRGTHIDEVVSLNPPFLLQLRCAQASGLEHITFEIDGVQVARGIDPEPLRGPGGGLYFEYTRGGAVGVFDDFEMVPESDD